MNAINGGGRLWRMYRCVIRPDQAKEAERKRLFDEMDNPISYGRSGNTYFEFDIYHPLNDSHVQHIRSK